MLRNGNPKGTPDVPPDSFVRALAGSRIDCGIRVNVVAPGPVWTPRWRAGGEARVADADAATPSAIFLSASPQANRRREKTPPQSRHRVSDIVRREQGGAHHLRVAAAIV
jgi:NAD(P)-dependent dehydrogenase (short-subunit alcohol dehydrogenase family)